MNRIKLSFLKTIFSIKYLSDSNQVRNMFNLNLSIKYYKKLNLL